MTKQLLICTNFRANPNNPSCAKRGSPQILADLKQKLVSENCAIDVQESPCMGYCNVGPNLRLAPNGEFYHEVSAKKLAEIVNAVKMFTKD